MSAPEWLGRMLDVAGSENGLTDTTGINPVLQRQAQPADRTRSAAVLVLFGGPAAADPTAPGGLPAEADVLLTQRASTLRDHSGQIAFPGGATDLPPGAVIVVLATDPAAAADLPAWCRMLGHTVLDLQSGEEIRAEIRLGAQSG